MYEVLTTPSAFPALGHDVSMDCRTHPRDLLAQKLGSSPHSAVRILVTPPAIVNDMNSSRKLLDGIAIPLALIMLVFWAIGAFAWTGPGWIHLFLTLGVFLLIYGIVARTGRGGPTARP